MLGPNARWIATEKVVLGDSVTDIGPTLARTQSQDDRSGEGLDGALNHPGIFEYRSDATPVSAQPKSGIPPPRRWKTDPRAKVGNRLFFRRPSCSQAR